MEAEALLPVWINDAIRIQCYSCCLPPLKNFHFKPLPNNERFCLQKGWHCTCERRLGHIHLDMEIQENCKSGFLHKKTKYTLIL